MESPAAVIDVSTECKGMVRRDESREFDDPFSTCSASYEGSVVCKQKKNLYKYAYLL